MVTNGYKWLQMAINLHEKFEITSVLQGKNFYAKKMLCFYSGRYAQKVLSV
jgi:hypothetical protein